MSIVSKSCRSTDCVHREQVERVRNHGQEKRAGDSRLLIENDRARLATNKSVSLPSIVGSLNYAAIMTRPDIGFSFAYVSRFQTNYDETHIKYAKQIFAYLNQTKNHKLRYSGKDAKIELIAYVDADFGTAEDRRSTSGYVIMMAGGAISWSSRKQRQPSLSSAEAEYIALSDLSQEIKWLRMLLAELGHEQKFPTMVYEDNQPCIVMASQRVTNQRTKHIDIKYHFTRHMVETNEIKLEYVKSCDNAADMFTKALARPNLHKHHEAIGLFNSSAGCVRV